MDNLKERTKKLIYKDQEQKSDNTRIETPKIVNKPKPKIKPKEYPKIQDADKINKAKKIQNTQRSRGFNPIIGPLPNIIQNPSTENGREAIEQTTYSGLGNVTNLALTGALEGGATLLHGILPWGRQLRNLKPAHLQHRLRNLGKYEDLVEVAGTPVGQGADVIAIPSGLNVGKITHYPSKDVSRILERNKIPGMVPTTPVGTVTKKGKEHLVMVQPRVNKVLNKDEFVEVAPQLVKQMERKGFVPVYEEGQTLSNLISNPVLSFSNGKTGITDIGAGNVGWRYNLKNIFNPFKKVKELVLIDGEVMPHAELKMMLGW